MKAYHLSAPMRAIIGICSLGLILSSCDPSKPVGKDGEPLDMDYKTYISSSLYQQDLKNVRHQALLSQCMKCLYLQAASNNFTLKKGEELHFGENKQRFYATFYHLMGTLEEYQDEFRDSNHRLYNYQVFSKSTSENAKQATLHNSPTVASLTDLVATPAKAAPSPMLVQPILIQELAEFCGVTTKLAKQAREASITIAAKIPEDSRRQLFESLPARLKKNETDYQKWWRNFEKGDYDRHGNTIYYTFMSSFDNESGGLDFVSEAQDLGLDTEDRFMSAAGQAVTAGAKLYVECVNKVLSGTLQGTTGVNGYGEKVTIPGYGDMYDKVEQVVSTVNHAEKIVKGDISMKDALGYLDLIHKHFLAEEIKDHVFYFPGLGEFDPNVWWFGAGELQGIHNINVATACDDLTELVEADIDIEKANKIILENQKNQSTIKVKDSSNTPGETIIVEDTKNGGVYIGEGVDENGCTSVTVPGEGEYNVTVVDETGDKWTVTDQKVENGEDVTLQGNTEERKEIGAPEPEKPEDMTGADVNEKEVDSEEDLDEEEMYEGVEEDKDEDEALGFFEQAREKSEKQGTPTVDREETTVPSGTSGFDIVGSWKVVNVNNFVHLKTGKPADDEDIAELRSVKMTLRSNHTFVMSSYDETVSGTYSFDGMTLALHAEDETLPCPITKLSSNKAQMIIPDPAYGIVIIIQKQ